MEDILNNQKKLWREFIEDSKSIDLSSLELKNELNADIWDDMSLRSEISENLIQIVNDFLQNIGLEGLEHEDITFTGSLANYNWSKYSDIDLHIIVNFAKIDENIDLVREFFRGKYGIWNKSHDIMIKGFEVEIYVQDSGESHVSTGVYSVLNNEWLTKPSLEQVDIDTNNIKMKASKLMCLIDCAREMFYSEDYKESSDFASKIRRKIKKFRQCGLERGGQYSSENLAFKVLRRNGYLKHLSDVITNSYDRMLSMAENFNKKIRKFAENEENSLKEEEKFQEIVKNNNFSAKKDLIGHGEQENEPPYTKKPDFKRSKSSPPSG